MFGVYDGHGGDGCCNFLKEYLHKYVFESLSIVDQRNSITTACLKADSDFIKKCEKGYFNDRSGSCAVCLVTLGMFTFT